MPKNIFLFLMIFSMFSASCQQQENKEAGPDTIVISPKPIDSAYLMSKGYINTKDVKPAELIQFAKTLLGTKYVFACANPKKGFDCSGFVNYVFAHYGIGVPRSSSEFTNIGKEIPLDSAKAGDIILFTGTNPNIRHVGHLGIVVSNTPGKDLEFIHASSGKAMGVVITPLNGSYEKRYVKMIRVFVGE